MDSEVTKLFERLDRWVEAGALRALDLALARFIRDQGPENDPAVLLAVALTSERNGHGHVCLDLQGALEHPDRLLTRWSEETASGAGSELMEALSGLSLAGWVGRLARSVAVTDRRDDEPPSPLPEPSLSRGRGASLESADEAAPLVLAGAARRPLLYLRRYWRYETRIREGIQARLRQPVALPEAAMRDLLRLLFDEETADADPWQKIACALAARSAFAIITGGPGTGKTTTVVRLLALLQGLSMRDGGPALRIRLAAPTGKAAARLNESIAGRVASLPFERLPEGERMRPEIPTEASTLHRLLGPIPDSRHFRHHAGNPLPADILVVDEASMVDVEMMAALLDALRPDARLILLGDKDQLASVEAGAVLGDLCQRARAAHYTPETGDWLYRTTGARIDADYLDPNGRSLDQAIAMLRHSYRFKAEGGIGALAELVNEGTVDGQGEIDRVAAMQALFDRKPRKRDHRLGRIQRIQLSGEQDPALDALVLGGYRGYLERMRDEHPGDLAEPAALDAWARAVIEAQAGFQLLTPLRQGPWGVEGLNRRILEVLSRGANAPLGAVGERQWFPGRPVLVTRNDPALRLMNGDIGIALEVPGRRVDGQPKPLLRVAFPAGDGSGGIRWILPSRLQAVETVFAMTVHKSQGSEFTHTALILPDTPNPVLTRELVYTGITRSREVFTLLFSREDVVREALERRVERVSGLAGALV